MNILTGLKMTKAEKKALLALYAAKCYGETFAFPGKHEAGCWRLQEDGLARTHPKGLRDYSRTACTLTGPGTVTVRQAFQLNDDGVAVAKAMTANHPSAIVATPPADLKERT